VRLVLKASFIYECNDITILCLSVCLSVHQTMITKYMHCHYVAVLDLHKKVTHLTTMLWNTTGDSKVGLTIEGCAQCGWQGVGMRNWNSVTRME